MHIRRRSDYVIGFIAPAIGPNKSRKLTRFMAPAHNIRGKVWMKNNIHGFTNDNCLSVKSCVLFFIQTLPRILCSGAISYVSFLDLFGPIAGAIYPIIKSLLRRIGCFHKGLKGEPGERAGGMTTFRPWCDHLTVSLWCDPIRGIIHTNCALMRIDYVWQCTIIHDVCHAPGSVAWLPIATDMLYLQHPLPKSCENAL